MKKLSCDIETFSDVDLIRCGVYKYADSPNFEMLLFAYAVDDGDVHIIDIAGGEELPEEIIQVIKSDTVVKTAYNAQFERVCLSRYLKLPEGEYLNPQSWYCTAVQAAELALPLSLADVGSVLGLERQKMTEGKELIKYFCVPCKPTKSNGNRTRNRPCHDINKWETFKKYCMRDVDVERQIADKLKMYPISDEEHRLYVLDQIINDRGVLVDCELAKQAVKLNSIQSAVAVEQAYMITGLENPNSVTQLKQWLKENGVEIESMSKKAVKSLADETDGDVSKMLKLRLLMAKTSVKKYEAVIRSVCSDNRVHGMMRFCGANRTGRWSGNILQPQNLPQNHLPDLTLARDIVKDGDFEMLDMMFGNVPNVLSELIRTVLIPKPNHRFIVADFSAIEARVLAWIAGEQWRIDTFKNGGDIYCASASKMFKVPVEKNGVNGELRQKGKISELACGYGGSVGALKNMGAVEMGVQENELQGLINDWRNANPHIVRFWYEVGNAAMKAIKEKTTVPLGKLVFAYERGILFIRLPSGRRLSYIKPRIGTNRFGGDSITYMGINSAKKWDRLETFGGKLTENIVQGTARDLLANALINAANAGYDTVFHVHDEIICEVPNGYGSVDELCRLMCIKPEWADGLPLNADGFECEYYKKE
ncbi:DNA polymerase [Hominilimicola sp.]|uniref:DNA polymerase n=1 Tax=Hominilimicola sp. TaxID=3073571 RepID=UPI00307BD950